MPIKMTFYRTLWSLFPLRLNNFERYVKKDFRTCLSITKFFLSHFSCFFNKNSILWLISVERKKIISSILLSSHLMIDNYLNNFCFNIKMWLVHESVRAVFNNLMSLLSTHCVNVQKFRRYNLMMIISPNCWTFITHNKLITYNDSGINYN